MRAKVKSEKSGKIIKKVKINGISKVKRQKHI